MIDILDKFKKLMNTRTNYKFGFVCGLLLLLVSILSIGFLLVAKFLNDMLMQDYWWKLIEMVFYLMGSIWLIIIYLQPDYVEEEIKVYDVPNKFGENK